MLDLVLSLVLSFFCGFLVKAVDFLEDEKKSKNPIKYVAAICYGILIGVLISYSSFSLIFIAAFLAQFVSRKVDNYSHILGCVVAVLFVALLWDGSVQLNLSTNVVAFVFLLSFAVLDELSDQFAPKNLKEILSYRPFLKIASLFFFVFSHFDYFFGIILFDFGYELFSYSSNQRKKSKKV